MPAAHILDALMTELQRLPGFPDLRILDLSCGDGELLGRLETAGCRQLEGTHFQEDDYIVHQPQPVLQRITVHKGIHLDQTIPLPDASYDVVTCSEVLEHLPTHFVIFQEVARLLRPGGWLLLTTPNLHRLHSRLHFFLTGTHKLIRRRAGWDLGPDRLHEFHVNPVDFPLMHTLVHQAGMKVERLGTTRVKRQHAYLLAFWPWIKVASWFEAHTGNDHPEFARGERALFRWMTSWEMLTSEQLLVVCRKGNGSGERQLGVADGK